MKQILFLICGVAFFQNIASGRLATNSGDIVGVSQRKFREYVEKALKGFKNVMLQGDEELDYPVMDPYKLEPFSWEYADTSGRKKYRLNFFNKDSAVIKGLSHYYISDLEVSAKDMKLSFEVYFNRLDVELPYKLDGYFFKNIIPVYGEGLIKLSSYFQSLNIAVDLGTDQGYITVENVQITRDDYNANVKVTGLMDLKDKFASALVDNILDQIVKKHADEALTKFARNLIEEAIGGMSTEELFELLDHFMKKNDQLVNSK